MVEDLVKKQSGLSQNDMEEIMSANESNKEKEISALTIMLDPTAEPRSEAKRETKPDAQAEVGTTNTSDSTVNTNINATISTITPISQVLPTTTNPPTTTGTSSFQSSSLHQRNQPQLGQRPTSTNNRRLTIHETSANSSRPSLLTKQLSFKSSSAVPTLTTLAATPTVPTLLNYPAPSTRPQRASSGSGLNYLRYGNMAARDYSATDLLKQAISHRLADEDTDHVDSTSSTPPGAVTPRPDLTDKRLPGILHSCFGQVGNFLRDLHPETRPAVIQSLSSNLITTKHSSTPKPSTFNMLSTPPLPPDGGNHVISSVAEAGDDSTSTKLQSQSPSTLKPLVVDSSRSLSVGSNASFDFCLDPTAQSSQRTSEARSSSSSRNHTPISSSTSTSGVAYTSVLATLLTKPFQKKAQYPTSSFSSLSRALSQSNAVEREKLTEGVSSPIVIQSTPPQTPRTRSHEDQNGSTMTTPTRNSTKPISTDGTTVGPVLGKLTVVISEGRGLRPSIDPYVVCEFQLSQFISEGPIGKDRNHGASKFNSSDGAIAIHPAVGDRRRPLAIPMKSRQSSSSGRDANTNQEVTNPRWDHKAVFDVVGEHAEIDISVYDRTNQEAFLGHVRFCPSLKDFGVPYDRWFTLEPRDVGEQDSISGEIHLKFSFQTTDKKHYGPEDFEILKLIGKGTFGQVFQVRKKDTLRIYAMKVLSKKVIVQKKEVAHTVGERNILVRTAMSDSPFIVGLKFSFQTPTDLYLVTDYMSGGELFWHLQKEGRFNETRAKFYVAELILALKHLHKHNIVYRDLKPENILLDANGHVALCDFGLSKANLAGTETTNTFCGTTEYLAPEVLLDEHGYTKMVDFWSLGVLVFEMCCGWSPFYAEDTQQMYRNIAFGKVRFPRDALSTEGRNFVKGLLNRNPKHRLGANTGAAELMDHPFFADVDWEVLGQKKVVPPFKPKLKGELDVSNFDPEFTNALSQGGSLNARAAALASGVNPASTPLSPTIQANFEGFTFVDESAIEKHLGHRNNDFSPVNSPTDRDDDDWERIERTDRMSGVLRPQDSDEGFFSDRFEY